MVHHLGLNLKRDGNPWSSISLCYVPYEQQRLRSGGLQWSWLAVILNARREKRNAELTSIPSRLYDVGAFLVSPLRNNQYCRRHLQKYYRSGGGRIAPKGPLRYRPPDDERWCSSIGSYCLPCVRDWYRYRADPQRRLCYQRLEIRHSLNCMGNNDGDALRSRCGLRCCT